MRKGMKITIIIMLAMFIIGAMLMIIGIATGGTLRFNVDYFGRRVDTSSELYHGEESVGTFNDVDVRMDSGEVKIVRGSEYKVSYAIRGSKKPTLKNENGKLVFSTPKNQFNISLNFNDDKDNPYLTITIPDNADLNEVKLDSDAGATVIEGINFKDLQIISDTGATEISDVETDTLNIDADTGTLALKNVKAKEVEVDKDSGAINIDNLTCDTFDGKCATGDFTLDNSTIEKFVLVSDTGKTTVSEGRISDIKITSDYGSIKLGLIGEEADYTIKSKVDFGSNVIDGRKQGSSYSSNGGKKNIDIEADSGDVEIDFK